VALCAKIFPYPDFFCHFGPSPVCAVVALFQGFQFRSLLARRDWEALYQSRLESGIENLSHQLYAGLLRYQEKTEEAIHHCQLEIAANPQSLIGKKRNNQKLFFVVVCVGVE
jgi:hypothetical protein